MGQDEQSLGDPQGKVRGTDGLRVVGASIRPTIIASNTNAHKVMIAETIARMVLATCCWPQGAENLRSLTVIQFLQT